MYIRSPRKIRRGASILGTQNQTFQLVNEPVLTNIYLQSRAENEGKSLIFQNTPTFQKANPIIDCWTFEMKFLMVLYIDIPTLVFAFFNQFIGI